MVEEVRVCGSRVLMKTIAMPCRLTATQESFRICAAKWRESND